MKTADMTLYGKINHFESKVLSNLWDGKPREIIPKILINVSNPILYEEWKNREKIACWVTGAKKEGGNMDNNIGKFKISWSGWVSKEDIMERKEFLVR